MIRHAMAYVQMADNVQRELNENATEHELFTHRRLERAKDQLVAAEKALIDAYGYWRAQMEEAAHYTPRAQTYLERTRWDLT